MKVNANLDMSSGALITDLTAGSASGHAVEYDQLNTALALKQNTLSIAAGSSNYLSLSGDELSVTQLLIADVHVHAEDTLAACLATDYTAGDEFQTGDVLILTGAGATAGEKVWIHNGGSAGTAADFTNISDPLTTAQIQSAITGTGAIDVTAGVVSAQVDGVTIEINGSDNLQLKDASVTEAKLASDVDAESFVLSAGYSASAGTVAIGDTVEEAIEKLQGNLDGIGGNIRYAETSSLVASTPLTVTHSLGSADVSVTVYDSNGNEILVDVDTNNSTTAVEVTSVANVTNARIVVKY